MRSQTKLFAIAALMGLLISLVAIQTASAALLAFSPNPARLNGVSVGGLPSWYQDQNGIAVDPCLDIAACGLVAAAEPGVFNPALPLAFPANFPSEAFYFNATTADFSMGAGGTAFVILALEYTFVNPVTGALTTPQTPGALGAVFQRQRVIQTFPAGVPITTTGPWTLTTPWGTTTFPAANRCQNQAGGTKCTMTIDLPAPGAIPPNLAAALGTGVPGSISTFIKDPLAPTGFLGNAGPALNAVTTDAVATPATVTLTDPLGNSGSTTSYATITGKITGMDVQPGNNHDFGAVIMPATSPVHTVSITNTTLNAITFPALTLAAADAADFAITQSATAPCSGAVAPAATCSFDLTFTPLPAAKAKRVATIALAPTAALPANNPPPVTLSLAGTAQVKITTALATPHGTIAPDATAVPIAGAPGTFGAPAGSPVTFTVTPSNKKFKVKELSDVAGAAAAVPVAAPFTINTAAANHTVTATFMQSGDLDADGFLNVNDALKALRIVSGLQQADVDDPNNSAVKVAPLTGGVPAALDAKANPDIGDVLVILRRALNLDTW